MRDRLPSARLGHVDRPFLLQTVSLRAADTDPESKPTPPPKPATETAVPASADTNFDVVANSVVKIFSTARYPDVFKPWTKTAPSSATGSGVVIEGKRILSNAHVVEYASQVQIQANQSGDKINATVESIAPGIDLAVLKLDDETFFDTHPPLPRAKMLPEIKDAAMVYGYPEGGTSFVHHEGNCFPNRIYLLQFSRFRPANPNRCRHQSRQQRRPRGGR